MKKEVEEALIKKVKELHGKKPLTEIQRELQITRSMLYYLLGKCGLNIDQERLQYITKVRWTRQREKGKDYYVPQLRVSRRIVRELDLRDGDAVLWSIVNGKIVGTPVV